MGAGAEPRSEMWIVVSATSATWTASSLAIAATGATARDNIAATASHQGTTGMAMTATADLATALRAIMGSTEEVGHQPAIRLITVDKQIGARIG
jgi:Trk-type K+ transport system membrane component